MSIKDEFLKKVKAAFQDGNRVSLAEKQVITAFETKLTDKSTLDDVLAVMTHAIDGRLHAHGAADASHNTELKKEAATLDKGDYAAHRHVMNVALEVAEVDPDHILALATACGIKPAKDRPRG